MWRKEHGEVSCGHFKNGKPSERERSPNGLAAVRNCPAAEHRDGTRIGLVHIAAICPNTKPIVIGGSVLVRDGMSLSNPAIVSPKHHLPPNKSQSTEE